MTLKTSVPFVPPTAPFNAQQRAWLNGYFAGLTSFADTATEPPVAAPKTVATKPLLILYGSQTGSAEGLAKKFGKESAPLGFAPKLLEANACTPEQLAGSERLLLITSTWGEGDAPDNAAHLLTALTAADAPRLEKISFSVLALGDKNYSDFCGAGKKFDAALEQLGAKRIHPRVDCDLDYEAAAKEWAAAALKALGEVISESVISNQSGTVTASGAANTDSLITPSYSRKNPFPARLLVNRLLTGEGSAKEVRHFAISLEGSGLSYEAGDALGVMPANCPALVSDWHR